MGAKDSKPTCITYEEAVRRVTEAELKRLKEAFKRLSNVNGLISKQSFVKDVLGDGVPIPLSEYIYVACGGTPKGIALKELLCGLVLITRGQEEEKIKYLFGLYSNENGTHVVKDEIQKHLQLCESGVPDSISVLFNEDKERVTFEEFRIWMLANRDATSLSRWLLCEPTTVTISNELETPTFYQTLAGVTHLEEREIIELEKRYWVLKGESRTGKLDQDTLRPLVSPPVPLSVCSGVFGAFDENRDNHIDFKEMACGVSAATRGPLVERQKFCFKVFDLDRDGFLSDSEMEHMVTVLLHMHLNSNDESGQGDARNDTEVLAELRSRASDRGLTTEEYLIWAVGNSLTEDFLNLIFQVCHIVLGLVPVSPTEEGELVRGWLEREESRGYSVGQFWYLVAMDWWNSWLEYVGLPRTPGSITGSESNLSNLTLSEGSSGGSLKRVAQRLTGGPKRTIVENCVALETSPNVVVTGITHLDAEPQILAAPNISLATPSPSQSPRPSRRFPLRPGPIDNAGLIAPPMFKVSSLTGEGGKLKRTVMLARNRDFQLVPDSLWKALSQWYSGSPPLPRQVIQPKNGTEVELELYPLTLKLLRHQSQPARPPAPSAQSATWSGMVSGYGAAALSTTGLAYVTNLPTPPKRYLAYLATFSRMATVGQVYDFLCDKLHHNDDDMRLWFYRHEDNMILMEEDDATLEELGVCDEDQILIEIRNKDLSWPEEMGSLANSSDKGKQPAAVLEKGATGLSNLGNTCFMNSSLQCVSNTKILTRYFIENYHLYELNRTNPLGMKGHIAKRFGDLIHELWNGSSKTVAPLKLRWTLGKYESRFNGSQQHDAQELLAFLLDGLHEDLNRVHDQPYVELNDSDGRSDINVAQEAWENHILRNKSVIVDLFHGQLKSKVRCLECNHESVRFDPFNVLSLPLPMESYIHLHVIVIRLDGTMPMRYGLRQNSEDKFGNLKQNLSCLCNIPPFFIKLAEISGSQIKSILHDDNKVRPAQSGGGLYAYELPVCPPGSVCDEERLSINSLKSQREAQTFQAIQRSVQPHCTPMAPPRAFPVQPPPSDESASIASVSTSTSPTEAEAIVSLGVVDTQAVEGTEPVPDSGNCSASSCSLADSIDTTSSQQANFLIAFHRKLNHQDVYFMSSQKSMPSLFGLPVIVPCSDSTTHQDLYQSVWLQVARLVSPLPPSETAPPNHAMDCDDSLGYEFPFTLKAVNKDGLACAWCPWYRFCRGCRIQCCDSEFNFSSNYLAIDWDATALHLRYQSAQERVCEEHSSVAQIRQLQLEPIDLGDCLEAFTKEEQLGPDEKYFCPKCQQHQLASKKLQIWRLPPILIVHLKRFQYVNGKWIKSQKVVRFPSKDFDPTAFLASIPRETVLKHQENLRNAGDSDTDSPESKRPNLERTESSESATEPLQDFHQHLLTNDADPFNLKYNLYAISSHSGALGGGHYVAYAHNPNGKWYCYNDSSCKEVTDLDPFSAYMLFYEREGVCEMRYMPNVAGRPPPDTRDLDEEFDSDLKKMCSLM